MKKIYWRPAKVSRTVLILLAVFSLGGLVAVDRFRIPKNQPYFKEKIAASQLAQKAFRTIKKERLRLGIPIDPEADPAQTGLIGELISSITSNKGHLPAKQTTVNPNFAAVVVHLLKEARVRPGDLVAVGLSGSFPAINMAVYAALETLRLKPVVISSASSSQWGANIPEFSWLDQENFLLSKKIFSFHSAVASLGGIEDKGLGMSKRGRRILAETVARNKLTLLEVKNYQESVLKRMAIYAEQAEGVPIRAYINVGGGTSSVGKKAGKLAFRAGLVTKTPAVPEVMDSVMIEFSKRGVPVVHLIRFNDLAERYGLPIQPDRIPGVGEGIIFVKKEYSKILTTLVLGLILFLLFAFVRSDLGFRIVQTFQGPTGGDQRSEKMV